MSRSFRGRRTSIQSDSSPPVGQVGKVCALYTLVIHAARTTLRPLLLHRGSASVSGRQKKRSPCPYGGRLFCSPFSFLLSNVRNDCRSLGKKVATAMGWTVWWQRSVRRIAEFLFLAPAQFIGNACNLSGYISHRKYKKFQCFSKFSIENAHGDLTK